MTITISLAVVYGVLYTFVAALAGLGVYLGAIFWFWGINEIAKTFGVHAEILYFICNRKAIREAVANRDETTGVFQLNPEFAERVRRETIAAEWEVIARNCEKKSFWWEMTQKPELARAYADEVRGGFGDPR